MTLEKMMVLLTGLDQSAKSYVEARPSEDFPHAVPGTDGRLMIYRSHNAGLPFGFMEDRQELIKALPLAATSMLALYYIWLKSRNERKLLRFALALVLSGSLSNLCDRYLRHYVVDYICINAGELKKVVFNIGDLCVISGFLMMGVIEIARGLGVLKK